MISVITNYIIDRFQDDAMVHTIALSDTNIVDTKKENIYPLVNIRLLPKNDTNDAYGYGFRIHVLQQRDANRKVKPSKLMQETNFIDNMGDCESICNRFINYTRRVQDFYTIDASITLNPLTGYGGADLDGYTFDCNISMPNIGSCEL